jgi:hypothetical protein
MSEIITNPIQSSIVRLKFAQMLARRDQSVKEIDLFQEINLSNARSISEAINSGERTFSEFLQFLKGADRFKHWLKTVNPDANLLTEYLKASTSETWINRLAPKSVRFVVATGLGLASEALFPSGIGATVGVGVGAIDSLLLDRVLKGWRPSHFVEGPLTRFTASDE